MSYWFNHTFRLLFILFLSPVITAQAQVQSQLPIAAISASKNLALSGENITLSAAGSTALNGEDLIYIWSLLNKPEGSFAQLTTPSTTSPQFIADKVGVYVVSLKVNDGSEIDSEPVFAIVTVPVPIENSIFAARDFDTPNLCAISFYFFGCEEETVSFNVSQAQSAELVVRNNGVSEILINLNSQDISIPSSIAEFSVPVDLLTSNTLWVTVKGGVGSSVNLKIATRTLPEDNNSAPTVTISGLATVNSRSVTGQISVFDISASQSHVSELLVSPENGIASIFNQSVAYTPNSGFKGVDPFYILTSDDGTPVKSVVTKASPNVIFNTAPLLAHTQLFAIKREKASAIRLQSAVDAEGDSLTYSLVSSPRVGVLSGCLDDTNDLICDYTPPINFLGAVTFSYRVFDGSSYSLVNSEVTINVRRSEDSLPITHFPASHYHTCVVYINNKVRCWGRNSFGQLGHGHTNRIGDDEEPDSVGFVPVGASVKAVAVGANHSCGLLTDGNIKCWGANYNKQIGHPNRSISIGDDELASEAPLINIGAEAYQLVSGNAFNCALDVNGRVKCWGNNNFGQLGINQKIYALTASDSEYIDFGEGKKPLKIVASGYSACALFSAGRIKCWGANASGHLGYGHTNNIGDSEDLSVVGFVDVGGEVEDIVLGEHHTCVLLTDGNVKCWGSNEFEQLGQTGLENIGDNELPSSIGTLKLGKPAVAIYSGADHACALLNNNTFQCWGRNISDQIGQDSESSFVPSPSTAISFNEKIISFSLGGQHTCVMFESGNVRCWGNNYEAQLGLGHRNYRKIDDIKDSNLDSSGFAISARFNYSPLFDLRAGQAISFSANDSFFANEAISYSWDFGDASSGSSKTVSHTYSQAGFHTVRLTVTDNLGQTESVSQTLMVRSNEPPIFSSEEQKFIIIQGENLDFNLRPAFDDRDVDLQYSIATSPGKGTLSECLDGTNDLSCSYLAPTDFSGEVRFTYKANDGSLDSNTVEIIIQVVVPETSIVKMASQKNHRCVLYKSKKIRCWGDNSSGQLGYGHNHLLGVVPANINFVDVGGDVADIFTGFSHTCVLLVNGNIKCWGDNSYGQLGYNHTNTIGNDELPSSQGEINFGEKVVSMTLGDGHTCALLGSRNVKCWGRNNFAQLGLGHIENKKLRNSQSELIENVNIGAKVIALVGGEYHTCALREDQTLRCWGSNSDAQLGLGHDENIGGVEDELPYSHGIVSLQLKIKEVFSGDSHLCARLSDDSFKCWGNNYNGELGYGRSGDIGEDELLSDLPALSLGNSVEISSLALGGTFTCLVLVNGNIKCWGKNHAGQLGRRNTEKFGLRSGEVPSALSEINIGAKVAKLSLGDTNACALLFDGQVKCWGGNYREQLALGHHSNIGDNETVASSANSSVGGKHSRLIARFDTSPIIDIHQGSISFDAGLSFSPPPHTLSTFSWDFGDGNIATGLRVKHIFSSAGTYNVKLTVINSNGETNEITKAIVFSLASAPDPEPDRGGSSP